MELHKLILAGNNPVHVMRARSTPRSTTSHSTRTPARDGAPVDSGLRDGDFLLEGGEDADPTSTVLEMHAAL